MKIRIIITFFLASLFWKNAESQITVLKYSKAKNEKFRENLYSSTLIFVVADTLKDQISELENELKNSWTITKSFVITYDELPNYVDSSGYSYMLLEGAYSNYEEGYQVFGVYIKLGIMENSDRGKYFQSLATIDLYPTYESMDKFDVHDSIAIFYKRVKYYNYNPGFISLYVKTLSDYFNNDIQINSWNADIRNIPELVKMRKDTLYIPQYTRIDFIPFSGNEEHYYSKKYITDKYTHIYTFVDANELSNKIVNKSIDYVLIFTKFGLRKFVNVYNVQTRQLIYSKYSKGAEFFPQDLGKIDH